MIPNRARIRTRLVDDPYDVMDAIKQVIDEAKTIQGAHKDLPGLVDRIEARWNLTPKTARMIVGDHFDLKGVPLKFPKTEAEFDTWRKAKNEDGPFHLCELTGAPPQRRWIIQDWLPEKEVSSFYGDGGLGKSLLAAQAGYAIAHGLQFLGLPTQKTPVLYVACEDDRGEIHRRIQSIRQYYGLAKEDGDFRLWPRVGKESVLATFGADNKMERTPFLETLRKKIEAFGNGPKLVILDTLTDVFCGSEINRIQANAFIKVVLRGLVEELHATILVIAHPSRAGKDHGDFLSGSTAWNNSVRNRLALKPGVLPDLRILERVKSNYAKRGAEIHLAWDRGVYVPVKAVDLCSEAASVHGETICRILRTQEENGMALGRTQNHAHHLRDYVKKYRPAGPDGVPLTLDLVNTVIDSLIAAGIVEEIKGDKKGKNGLFVVKSTRCDSRGDGNFDVLDDRGGGLK